VDIVLVVIIAAALALIPTLIYALLIWWLDRHEKEPLPLLLVAFMWGAVPAIILALVLEIGVGIPLEQMITVETTREITTASLVAPIVEEAVKAVILVVLFLAYRREFDNVLDGIVYGAMVGLGFAFVENVLYLTSQAFDGGGASIGAMLGLWVFRAGIFGLNHSMFTAFTGAALGYARSVRLSWQRGFLISIGLGLAMIFHGIHNFLASTIGLIPDDDSSSAQILGNCLGIIVSDYGGILLIVVLAFASGVRESQVIRETLLEEVRLGRFTPDEYDTLISGRKRWSSRWTVLFSAGLRRWRQLGKFFDLSTELAFRKHRMNDGDPIHQTISARDVARLRTQIDDLKAAILFS
jgi:protease PrsW